MTDKPLTFGSLFAGGGGFDLGFERAGMQCKWQIEINDDAIQVLEKHWPLVRRFRDVRECGAVNLDRVDVLCGGFPCQDISDAGKRVGIEGERSGLWKEYARIIRELRPRFVVVENVAALLKRGMGVVLGDLAECGFDAEWDVLPAFKFGLPTLRRRVFIVAYDRRERWHGLRNESRGAPRDSVLCRKGQTPHGGKVVRGTSLRNRLVPDWFTSGMDQRIPVGVAGGRIIGNAVAPPVAEWIGRRIVAATRS